MNRKYYSKIKVDDNFSIHGFFLFISDSSDYAFLLGKNGCSILLEKSLVSSLLDGNISEELKFKLLQHGLASMKKPRISVPKRYDNSLYFIIDVTKKCNFDCCYCFRNLEDNREISMERLEDICSYILKTVESRHLNNVSLQVWGGEPLLAMDKIEYIYHFFQNTNISLKIDVETNGSLITDKVAKKLFDMNIQVGISIDGMKKHQDFQRRFVNQKSSYEFVKKGIKNLQKYYGDSLGGITVVTKYNYQDITDIISFFITELNIHHMKFNLVKDNPNALESMGLTLEQVKEFATILVDSVELYNRLGFSFTEGNIQTRYFNLMERNPYSLCISNGCKGGKNLISIDQNGDIYPCEMMDYSEVKLGSIYENGTLQEDSSFQQKIKLLQKKHIYFQKKNHSECMRCPWNYYCQGGCTSRILYSNGKMKYDEVECQFNKVLYPKIIENILKSLK